MADPVTGVTDAVPAADNAQAYWQAGNDAAFQQALADAKIEPKAGKPTELWSYGKEGCLYKDHKDQFHIKTDVQAGCFEAKTNAGYTPFSFNTENNASLIGFGAKGTDPSLNGLKQFGLGGEWGLDERAGVIEAGASGSINWGSQNPGAKVEAHAGAIALEGDVRGTAGVYPSRWVDGLCNITGATNSSIPAVSETCKEVSTHDYGIAVNGKAGATVGYAAAGEAHAQLKDGRVDTGASFKLAPGIGPNLGVGIQFGRFDR
jgi:hypothetical protein